jgi:16S rRNA (cytidine1402-2'-O)-methyltransferase
VATPIGNLSDASPRALETLRDADLVACEDTRTTRTLLSRHGIGTRTVALHQHNERRASAGLIEALRGGKNIALVSDAGTPALSDPGAWLVREAHRAGIRVSPLPGPSAAAAAISVAGFAAPQFLFAGFLPATRSARRKALQALDLPWAVVFYEAPHRIAETLADLAERFGPARELAICRELTKKFEEVVRGPAVEVATRFAEPPKGEITLVIGAGTAQAPAEDEAIAAVAELVAAGFSRKDAAGLVARLTGVPRNRLYKSSL